MVYLYGHADWRAVCTHIRTSTQILTLLWVLIQPLTTFCFIRLQNLARFSVHFTGWCMTLYSPPPNVIRMSSHVLDLMHLTVSFFLLPFSRFLFLIDALNQSKVHSAPEEHLCHQGQGCSADVSCSKCRKLYCKLRKMCLLSVRIGFKTRVHRNKQVWNTCSPTLTGVKQRWTLELERWF